LSEKLLGYKGKALEVLLKSKAEVGDLIRVTKGESVYEGILIPRSELGDDSHVVVKIKSGYNVGVEVTPETKITKLGAERRPAFTPPELPEQNRSLPKVVIISTGGTIASRVDYRTGAVRPAISARDLYSIVPELSNLAVVDTEILFSVFSEDLTSKHWTKLAETVEKHVRGGADGVVVTHGTDTMGYTAAALSFALQDLPVPVIFVGSQRKASDFGWQRQAESSELGDGGWAVRKTIAKALPALTLPPNPTKCGRTRQDANSAFRTPRRRI